MSIVGNLIAVVMHGSQRPPHAKEVSSGEGVDGDCVAAAVFVDQLNVDLCSQVHSRHPGVEEAAGSRLAVNMHIRTYRELPGGLLTDMAVSLGHRIVATSTPPPDTYIDVREAMSDDRVEHNRSVTRSYVVAAGQLAALTDSLNQLLALEFVLFERLPRLKANYERHLDLSTPACEDCDPAAAPGSRARQ